jgi:transcriptional regulator with XRE-family HTH domain
VCQQLETELSADEFDLGQRLRQRRAELGWSLADLSARTGVSRAYISAIERGKSKRPGATTVLRLEDAVGPLLSEPKPVDAPAGLAAFAAEHGLPASDVQALAALRIRGRSPQSKERWAFIYQALLASESIDGNEGLYRANSPRARRPRGPS